MTEANMKVQAIKENSKTFLRVYRLLLQTDRNYILLNLCVTVINGMVPAALIIIMRNLINSLQTADSDIKKCVTLVLVYIIIDLCYTLISCLDSYFGGKFSLKMTGDLKTMVLKKTEGLSLKQFEDPGVYNLLQRADERSNGELFLFYQSHIDVIRQILILTSTAVILIMWKWWMVFVISLVPILLSLRMLHLNEEQYQIHRKRTDKDRMMWYMSFILTKDQNFKEIKLNHLHSYFVHKYTSLYQNMVDAEMPILKKRSKYTILFSFMDQVCLGGILLLIIAETFLKKILIGDTMAYINCISKVKENVSNVLNSIVSINKEQLYISQLFEFLDLETSFDTEVLYQLSEIDSIVTKGLSYRYQPDLDYVLRDVNLCIGKKQMVGIVGRNGSGKTTLTRILTGFYDDYEGEVFFNGINLKNIDKNSLRKLTAMLFQDFSKFELTVRENVGIGNLNYLWEDNLLKQSMAQADIWKFMDGGIDIQLGNWFSDGMQISGGEWQKIAISRVLLKHAHFLILDEPTASLDPISEVNLFHNIHDTLKEKISLIITHRLTELEKIADYIIILDHGSIVESGTHEQLLQCSETYQQMYHKLERV